MTPKFLTAFAIASLGLAACVTDSTGSDVNDQTEINAQPKDGGEVEIFRSNRSGNYDFRLEAKNGEILLQSGQGYDLVGSAVNGALSLKDNGTKTEGYEVLPDSSNREGRSDGAWYFRVKAANGAVLGFSESYSSKSAAVKGASTTMAYLKGKTKADLWSDQCGFEMYQGNDGGHWFRLRAANGEKLLRSQSYSTEQAAKTGIDTVVTIAIAAENRVADLSEGESMGNTERFELYEADVSSNDADRWGWRLVAANNEIVATGGELFSSKAAASDSLEVVRTHAFDEIACWTSRNDSELPLLATNDLTQEEETEIASVDLTYTPVVIEAEAADGGEVEIYRSAQSGKYDFRLEASNGDILLQSGQRYESMGGALNGALSLRANGQYTESIELLPDSSNREGRSDGAWYVRVKATNGAVLGFSQSYSNKAAATEGATTMMSLLLGDTKADLWSDQCGFEMYRGNDDNMWFRLRADNGEKVLRSQGYSNEQSAKTGIDTVVTTAIVAVDRVVDLSEGESMGNTERFELYEANVSDADTDRWGWRLVAANNEIVASGGELFSSKAAANDSLELVRAHAFEEISCWTARTDTALPSLSEDGCADELDYFGAN
jgi:uncharacterized protein YegP (UPF0339 family)